MDFKPGKFLVGAAVAISFGTFAVPFNSIANASTMQERLSHSESWVQLAQADSKVEEKTEQKTSQSTDSAGMPQADKHVEHETTETANDSNGSAKTQHKAEVNESTNAMGDTTKQTHDTTESSQHNWFFGRGYKVSEDPACECRVFAFPRDEISIEAIETNTLDGRWSRCSHGEDPADEKPREGSDKLKGLTIGAVSGGVILGTIGGLIGLASLAVPGLGLIVVAGPIAAALTDAAAGGAVGLIAGALMGMRIPEHRARQYEESVREGNTLVSVHMRNAKEFDWASKVLSRGGAEDVHEVIEAS